MIISKKIIFLTALFFYDKIIKVKTKSLSNTQLLFFKYNKIWMNGKHFATNYKMSLITVCLILDSWIPRKTFLNKWTSTITLRYNIYEKT